MIPQLTIIIPLLIFSNAIHTNAEDIGNSNSVLPVVMWHGMGDTCCAPFSLGSIKKVIQQKTNGTYVKSLEIGGNIIEDFRSGYFTHPNEQIEDACKQIRADPKLADGYNALGFSQGGQFLRALLQRCPTPQMNTLITFGAQHQGVFGVPFCSGLDHKTCEYIRRALSTAAYKHWLQRDLVQATYWHDPLQEDVYRQRSTFLNDINNAESVNQSYIQNLQSLRKFIMVRFMNDTMVQPKESSWFGFYAPGQDKKVLTLRETDLYQKNDLGLGQMDVDGKLIFLESEGDHLRFTLEWFNDNIIPHLLEN